MNGKQNTNARSPLKQQRAAKIAKFQAEHVNQGESLAYTMPKCSVDYARALVNPFDTPEGVCIPYGFPLPSSKTKVRLETTMTLGTSGVGLVCLKPTAANDVFGVTCTSIASAGTKATALSAFTNTILSTFSGLPYSSADISGSNIGHRLVAAGLRIGYIGKLADRGGVSHAYEDPDHVDCSFQTFDLLGATTYTAVARIGEGHLWDNEVTYSGPAAPTDVDYTTGSVYPIGNVGFMVIVVTGSPGDVYQVEAVEHLEYVGTKIPSRTLSHFQPNSYAAVLTAAKSEASNGALSPSKEKPFFSKVMDFFAQNLPKAINIAKTVGGAAGALLTKNPRFLMTAGEGLSGLFNSYSRRDGRSVAMQRQPLLLASSAHG